MKTSVSLAQRLGLCAALLTITLYAVSGQDAKTEAKPKAAATESKIDPRVAAKSISLAEAEKLIANKSVVILDVRTEKEFTAGHLAGAKNINSRAEDFKDQLAKLDKSKTYLLHSAGGASRVTKTVDIFDGLGFTNWVNLEGGYTAWTNAAKVVVK